MTRFAVLAIIALAQVAFIALTLGLLLVTRFRGSRSRERAEDADFFLAGPLQRLMLGEDRGESLAAALGGLRPETARRELMAIGGTRLSPEQRRDFAPLVRHAPWVEQTLAQATSKKWWKRMAAARLLVTVCDGRDERLVTRLVTDPHAAVASSATAAIAGCGSESLVEAVVERLPARPPSVRLQQCNSLRSHAAQASAAVVARLSQPAAPFELRAWIQLAEILATPEALAAVIPFASHADVDVRTATARALRYCFSPEGADAVTGLVRDADWRVRAAAARAVGALNVRDAIPLLVDCMHDESWWVRFRAGLALADLADEGQFALAAAQDSPDPFTRDMATLIRGLSDGSRLDLTSA